MSQCDQERGRGRGTEKTPFRSSAGINRETKEYLILRETGSGDLAVPRPLRLLGMPFVVTSARAAFLYFVTSRPAILLDRATRQAAAADPGLEWHAPSFGYRRRRR